MARFDTKENTGAKYTATIKDADGNALALADLATMTLTLYDVKSDAIINSRDKKDAKNANDVTIAVTGGLLTWLLQDVDNPIVAGTTTAIQKKQHHRGLFEYAYNGDGSPGKHELDIYVLNLGKVP